MLIYDYGGYNSSDGGSLLAVITIIAYYAVQWLVLAAVEVFYLLTMQKALNRCSPANRTLEPGMVWLQLIPLFGIVWRFFVVLKTSDSLDSEIQYRNIIGLDPGRGFGLATCILWVLVSVFWWVWFMMLFVGPPWLVCLIIYWVKIHRTSRDLDLSPVPVTAA